jgi:hypothetical protein
MKTISKIAALMPLFTSFAPLAASTHTSNEETLVVTGKSTRLKMKALPVPGSKPVISILARWGIKPGWILPIPQPP